VLAFPALAGPVTAVLATTAARAATVARTIHRLAARSAEGTVAARLRPRRLAPDALGLRCACRTFDLQLLRPIEMTLL
jgi:hypothetical protein